MSYNETYEQFISKFKDVPKTTDDCYTPRQVMEVIRKYVINKYNIKEEDIIQPFYPGGDYLKENYEGKIVVDNPPFSIISKIVTYYEQNGIKYFLFAPALTLFNVKTYGYLCTSASITYETEQR